MAEDGCELGRPLPSPLSHPFPQHSHVILQQLNLQRHYGVFCDVILRVDRYEFKAHKCVLAAGCPKLQSLLYSMHQDTSNVLSLKQVSVTGCRYILDFLYTGSLELKAMHVDDVIAAAKFLEVRDVEKACLDYQYYKGLNGDTSIEDGRQTADVLSQQSHIHFGSDPITDISTSNIDTSCHTTHATVQTSHTPSPTLPPISSIDPSSDYRPTSVPPPIDSTVSHLDPPSLYPPVSLPSLPQQNALHQLPNHSTSNLSFDTNYIEDYLKLIESMQNEQTVSNVAASSQLLSRPHTSYLDVQPSINSQPLASTQPAKTSLTFPGVGPNSTQFSAEDVRKTVLSVLSQEKFDDDDVSMSESDSVTSFAKPSPASISPATHSGSLPSIAHIVSSHNHTGAPHNHCEPPCDPQVPDSTLDPLKPSPFALLSSPDVATLKDEGVECHEGDSNEIKMHQKTELDMTPKEMKPFQNDDEIEHEHEIENDDYLEDDLEDTEEENEEMLEQKNGFILTPKLACKQKRKRKSQNKVNHSEKDCASPLTRLQHRLVSKRKRRFDCEKCGRQFEREDGLIKHQELHDRELLYSCHVCGLKYARSGELTRHLRKHSASLYSCKLCHANFKDPKEYKKHMTDVHEEDKPFRCQFVSCNFTADKPSLLEKHAAIHSDVKMYACPKCGKDFAQPNGLRSHLKSCLQQRSYLCDICGSKFNHLQSLKSHRMLHTGEKPHICKDCGARFTDHRNFKRHRRIHENLFPYPCSYCEKRFRHSNSLKAHLKTHGLDPSKMPPIIGEAMPSPSTQPGHSAEDDGILPVESHDEEDAQWQEQEMVIPVSSPL